jgi:hypothetical protein
MVEGNSPPPLSLKQPKAVCPEPPALPTYKTRNSSGSELAWCGLEAGLQVGLGGRAEREEDEGDGDFLTTDRPEDGPRVDSLEPLTALPTYKTRNFVPRSSPARRVRKAVKLAQHALMRLRPLNQSLERFASLAQGSRLRFPLPLPQRLPSRQMRRVRTEPRQPRRPHVLKRRFSDPAANLIDLLADDAEHDARGPRIGVNVERPKRSVSHRPLVMPMRAGRQAMHSLRGLHKAKLPDPMAPSVILNERANCDMDREKSLRLHTGLTKPCEGHTRL